MVKLNIQKWKDCAKIACVWGIDEIGNIGNREGIDHTDWGMHFQSEESFFKKQFLPIIEKFPKIKFTIGAWLGEYDGVTPSNELKEGTYSLQPFTEKWASWLEEAIKPIIQHEQIEVISHGLGHEDWRNISKEEKDRRLRIIQEIFQDYLGKRCLGFNTWPYGTIPRNLLPKLLPENGFLITGILTSENLDFLKKIIVVLKNLKTGKRYVDAPNTGKEIGEKVRQAPDLRTRIGELSLWEENLIAVPYTCAFGSDLSDIRNKFIKLKQNYKSFDAPIFYLFSHLRRTSPEKKRDVGNLGGIEGDIDKFRKLLSWLSEEENVWFTTLSKAAQYFDYLKRGKLKLKSRRSGILEYLFDTSDCFNWGKSIEVTFTLENTSREIESVSYVKKEGEEKAIKVQKIDTNSFNVDVSPNELYLFKINLA